VPAAAFAIDQLAAIDGLDFFSVGTNDLAQYFFAADRGLAGVSALCDPLQPAFLNLLQMIADAARRNKKWIGVCGEMAGDVRNLPIMAGLGLHEISVSPARVLEIKAALATLDAIDCRLLLQRMIAARDGDEVRTMLSAFTGSAASEPGRAGPDATNMIDVDLVVIGSDAASKIEAIKELVGLIMAAGRASDAHALEHAVWAREDTYATALGHGFAIPHCKSDALRSPTIAVLRLSQPIDWGAAPAAGDAISEDGSGENSGAGEPVRVAIMLAIPAGESAAGDTHAAKMHMQVLAKLARKLMHEDFRERILRASHADDVVAALTTGLSE
jgi:fructose-specific PTS system IIA-like component